MMKHVLRIVTVVSLLVLLPRPVPCVGAEVSASSPAIESSGWVRHVVDTGGDVGLNTAITLDSAGDPFISYHDQTNGTLKLARFKDSNWQIEVVDNTQDHVGHYTSIELDALDNPRISYGRFLGNVGWLKYAAWTGSGWQLHDIDAKAQGSGKHTSLALDLDGTPHISYTSFWNQNSAKYAHWTGSGWETEVVKKGGGGGGGNSPEFYMRGTSIVLDESGTPCFAFWGIGTDAGMSFACQAGRDWDIEIIEPGGGDFGSSNSLVLDSAGVPHISYYVRSGNDLKYARRDPATGTWEVQVIDSIGDVGLYSSIDVDGNDIPHISYHDVTNGLLKYARWDSATGWDIQVVDSVGYVGLYSSIAVDSTGAPHISYYDRTNGDLKYAVMLEACASNADCDDGNECTIDTCDTGTGACSNEQVADNTTCGGDGMICCGGLCVMPECAANIDCDDGDSCTDDLCSFPSTCASFCTSNHPECGLSDGCCGPDCDHSNDPDCPDCVPTHPKEKGPRCSDGLDNDCDGLVDGADPDC
jgi:hypothetical protein